MLLLLLLLPTSDCSRNKHWGRLLLFKTTETSSSRTRRKFISAGRPHLRFRWYQNNSTVMSHTLKTGLHYCTSFNLSENHFILFTICLLQVFRSNIWRTGLYNSGVVLYLSFMFLWICLQAELPLRDRTDELILRGSETISSSDPH